VRVEGGEVVDDLVLRHVPEHAELVEGAGQYPQHRDRAEQAAGAQLRGRQARVGELAERAEAVEQRAEEGLGVLDEGALVELSLATLGDPPGDADVDRPDDVRDVLGPEQVGVVADDAVMLHVDPVLRQRVLEDLGQRPGSETPRRETPHRPVLPGPAGRFPSHN